VELKARFAKIVGTPRPGVDSWVYVGEGLFFVLEINSPSDFPLASYGKEIINRLVSDYQNLSPKNLAKIKDLVNNLKTEEGVNVSLVLGVQVGKVFYLVCRGAGRVIIRRQGRFGIILSDDGAASGILEDKDIFLLTSPRFSELVSFDEVKNIFNNFTLAELAEGLTSLVHRTENTAGVAALILQFTAYEEPINLGVIQERKFLRIAAGKITSFFQRLILKRQTFQTEEKSKQLVLEIGVILAILLILSLLFGFGKRIKEEKENQFLKSYEIAYEQYKEGKALLGVNNFRSVALFSQAKTSLDSLSKEFAGKSQEAKKIKELLEKIDQDLSQARQEYKITPQIFFDINLIKEGGEGEKMAISEETMVVLDKKNSALYQINIKSKSAKILGGGEKLAGAKLIAVSHEAVYVLTDRGVIEIKIKNEKLKIDKDTEWGEIVDMETFAGNLYLLDKTNGKIWKYLGTEAGFSGKSIYLSHDRGPYRDNLSLAIDGSVWLTTEAGLFKFTQGRKENFEIKGLEQALGRDLLIFTDEDTKNLYLLDKINKRIVILEKNGNYQAQYQWPEMDFSDMVVSEKEKKILLLSGSKIYSVNIK